MNGFRGTPYWLLPEEIKLRAIKKMVKTRSSNLSYRKSLSISKLRNRNPNWKGNNITLGSGRSRAKDWFPYVQSCEMCGGKGERHHRDGDARNNEQDNIQFLCRRCHMAIDGRLEMFRKIEQVILRRDTNGRFLRREYALP